MLYGRRRQLLIGDVARRDVVGCAESCIAVAGCTRRPSATGRTRLDRTASCAVRCRSRCSKSWQHRRYQSSRTPPPAGPTPNPTLGTNTSNCNADKLATKYFPSKGVFASVLTYIFGPATHYGGHQKFSALAKELVHYLIATFQYTLSWFCNP